jgi:hypothetical protein
MRLLVTVKGHISWESDVYGVASFAMLHVPIYLLPKTMADRKMVPERIIRMN